MELYKTHDTGYKKFIIFVTDRSVDQSARVRLKLSLNKTRVQVVSFIASLSGCQFVSFAGGLVSLHLSLLHGFQKQIYMQFLTTP